MFKIYLVLENDVREYENVVDVKTTRAGDNHLLIMITCLENGELREAALFVSKEKFHFMSIYEKEKYT